MTWPCQGQQFSLVALVVLLAVLGFKTALGTLSPYQGGCVQLVTASEFGAADLWSGPARERAGIGSPANDCLPAECHSPIAAPGNLLKSVPGRTDWGARFKETQGTRERGCGGGSLGATRGLQPKAWSSSSGAVAHR